MTPRSTWFFLVFSLGLTSAFSVGVGCGSSAGRVVRPPDPESAPPVARGQGVPVMEGAMAAFLARDEARDWDDASCNGAAQRFRQVAESPDAALDSALVADALYMAGMAHQRCGQRSAAQQGYREALVTDPSHCRARVGVGLAELGADRRDLAEEAFRQAVAADNRCADAYRGIAELERKRGDLDSALTNLRRALAVEPNFVEALHEMALVHLARAEDDVSALSLAEMVCEQTRQVAPESAALFNTWGLINVQQGRIVDALGRFERAFTLDPTLYEAFMNFGQITLSFRGYEDAEGAFRAAAALNPESYDALIGHGVALRGLGRVEEAEARYIAARALDAERPEAWFNLGVLHQDHLDGSADELAEAVTHLEAFLTKAEGEVLYSDEVDAVSRCCRGNECRPGRLQNLRTALRAMGRSASGC